MASIFTKYPPVSKLQTESSAVHPDEFLTTQELMQVLKVKHKQTIYGLIQEGLPTVVVGGGYRFLKNEAIAYLKQHRNRKYARKRRNEK